MDTNDKASFGDSFAGSFEGSFDDELAYSSLKENMDKKGAYFHKIFNLALTNIYIGGGICPRCLGG